MDQIRQNMIKAASELRALAKTKTDRTLKRRLLEQAEQLELASQVDSQDETGAGPGRIAVEMRLPAP